MRNFLLLVLFIFLCLIQGCSHRDKKLESVFLNGLSKFGASNEVVLDLAPLIFGKWNKICVQTPYMLKENFEKASGVKIDSYHIIGDEINRAWIFYEDKSIKWVDIPRVSVMDFKQDSGRYCTQRQNPFLYAGEFYGKRTFYFMAAAK